VRPVPDVREALAVFLKADRGVVRVRSQEPGPHLACRFNGPWVLLDFWVTPKGPVLCPWFTNRELAPSQFHYFTGCPGCDTALESDVASAFSREEAYSVLVDYIQEGSLPTHVRAPGSSVAAPLASSAEPEDNDMIDWRPYQTLRRDR
jgi:hypothetical protein